jgi:hypothetical protein
MKKPVQKRKGGGKILGMLSPAAAIAQSLKSGKPEGILEFGLSPVMAIANQAKKRRARGTDGPSGPSAPTGVTRMKEGGKVGRGDGKCIKGRTKGRMV